MLGTSVRAHDWRTVRLFNRPRSHATVTATLGVLVPRARPFRLALAAVALLALPACGFRGLSFVQDERVDITRPDDRDEVVLPLRVTWTVEDFAVGPGRGSFGVLVDRTPPRPGKDLGWIFRGDPACKGTSASLCAKPEFLAQRNVFRTTARSLTIAQVARLAGSQTGRQFHEVTVVLLDEAGRRVGEGSWSAQFEVKENNK